MPSKAGYTLSPSLRRRLKRPVGKLFTPVELLSDDFLDVVTTAPLVVTVGDRVTDTLYEMGRAPDVSVVDAHERRTAREVPKVPHGETLKARNPAGSISSGALAAVRKAFKVKKPVMVIIDGEEDLLTLPAVIEAPQGSVVFYGQPFKGVVAVKVDERSKERARQMLESMKVGLAP